MFHREFPDVRLSDLVTLMKREYGYYGTDLLMNYIEFAIANVMIPVLTYEFKRTKKGNSGSKHAANRIYDLSNFSFFSPLPPLLRGHSDES